MLNARAVQSVQGLPEIFAIVLDLDGTIQTDRRLLDALEAEFIRYASAKSGWSHGAIEMRLAHFRSEALLRSEASISEFAFLSSIDVDLQGWLDRAETLVPLTHLIPVDIGLTDAFRRIHATRRVSVSTNSPWKLATSVLDRLKVRDHIDLIACPRNPHPDVDFPPLGKPSSSLYADIVEALHVPINHTLVIGDRREVDVDPAIAIGAPALLVDDTQNLSDVLEALLDFQQHRS